MPPTADIEIDPTRFELRRAGERVDVEPRVLDLILFLSANADRVVTRDELLDEVWKGTVVGDAALSRAVREARRALGDDGERQQAIVTVRGRGYRFVARTVSSTSVPAAPRFGGLYGRGELLASLGGLVDACRRGRGGAVLVTGEPGIGKSRLLQGLSQVAREHGVRAVLAHGVSGAGSPALWPLVQLLRALSQDMGPARLADAEPRAFAELSAWIAAPSQSKPLDDVDARFAILDAMMRVFEGLATQEPLVLIVDDLDLADSASRSGVLWLIRQLRTMPILWASSVGPAPVEPWASETFADARRVSLSGLDDLAVAKWARDATGTEPTAALVTRLVKVSRGNPLFIQHLLWSASASDLATLLDAPLPREVREVLHRNVAALPAAVRDVLEAASVAGTSFTVAMVADALDRPVDEVLPVVERLQDDGWIRPCREVPGELELDHATARETVYENLEPARRAQLHDRIGSALASRATDGDVVERVAHHLLRGSAAVRAKEGVDSAHRAAREALAKGAFDRCVAHCEAALEAMGLTAEPHPHPRRRDMTLMLASAMGRHGDLAGAAALFQQAAKMARPSPRPRTALVEREVRLVRESFEEVAPRLPEVVAKTYEGFFRRRPEVRGLFRRNRPELQATMVADALTSVVEHLHDTPWLEDNLARLGREHVAYGVTAEMFAWFEEALLESLRRALDESWSAPVAVAWERAIASVSAVMIDAMRQGASRPDSR